MSKIVGVTVGTPLSLTRIKEEVVPVVEQKVIEHEDNKSNPHAVTAEQIGLGSVDNTADIDKPVSRAQAEAIGDAKEEAIEMADNARKSADNHAANKENPHGITTAQIGAQVQHWNKVITLSAANWSGNSQSVVVAEIGKDDTIISTPSAESYDLYAAHGVKLSAQSAGMLTYTCEDAPAADISVDITCFGAAGSAGTGGGSGGGSGKDGISPVAKVIQTPEGAEISVTDANGTTTATVTNGADGYTPQKGIDYYTDADQESIIQQAMIALGRPVYGHVNDDKTIELYTQSLTDGTYTLCYEDKDGNWVSLGNLVIGEAVAGRPIGVNLVSLSVNEDGTLFVGDNGEKGYRTGYRLSSSGVIKEQSDFIYTGYMPVETGDTISLAGVTFSSNVGEQTWTYVQFYDADFNFLSYFNALEIVPATGKYEKEGVADSGTHVYGTTALSPDSKVNYLTGFRIVQEGAKYMRISAQDISAATDIRVRE